MRRIIDFLVDHWVRFLVAFLIAVSIMITYLAVNDAWALMIGYCDALFIAGFTLFAFAALATLNLFGAFDIFSFLPARRKKENGAKEDFYEYTTRKKEERGRFKLVFVPYLTWAVICLLVSLILLFLL